MRRSSVIRWVFVAVLTCALTIVLAPRALANGPDGERRLMPSGMPAGSGEQVSDQWTASDDADDTVAGQNSSFEPVVASANTPTAVAVDYGDWTNSDAQACFVGFGAIFLPNYIASYVPSIFQKAFEWVAWGADNALKFCAPVVEPPANVVRNPAGNACAYDITLPSNGQAGTTLEGRYENILGIPVSGATYGTNWGEIGTADVRHFNSDVDVLLEYYGTRVNDSTVRFPVGTHALTWRGETLLSPIDLVFIPLGLGYSKDQIKQLKKQGKLSDEFVKLFRKKAKRLKKENKYEDYLAGFRHGVYNEEIQWLVVIDDVPPEITLKDDTVVIEATQPGGIKRRDIRTRLHAGITADDVCDESPTVTFSGLPSFVPLGEYDLTWRVADDGPRTGAGGVNVTTEQQTVVITDTKPPIIVAPPSVVTETTTTPAAPRLGQPMIFDLVDLTPACTVRNASGGAPIACANASDTLAFDAGITELIWRAEDDSGNAATATQTINVKALGANNAPAANDAQHSATSYEPITITLTADDPDSDPLWFRLKDWPDNGFFIAPLYPYFIEDYRIESTQDSSAFCDGRSGSWQAEFPYEASYVAVMDDGTTYVVDRGDMFCTVNGDLSKNDRIAVFDGAGTLVKTNPEAFGSDVESIYIDERAEVIYLTFEDSHLVSAFDFDLNKIGAYRIDAGNSGPGTTIEWPTNAVADSQGILYVTDGYYVHAFDTNNVDGEVPAFLGNIVSLSDHKTYDMAVDSWDNLYISDRTGDRIYKYTASYIDGSGAFHAGQLVGWMGRCDTDTGDGVTTHCDVNNHRSIGFSCTDATCGLTTSWQTNGSAPGQFDQPQGIALDPNDVLYVTDYNNLRAQRFTPEGDFAGQAKSQCDGSCFVLGDFGNPEDITVNSTHFYILDQETNLLHVSETTPITPLDDSSASVTYSSENNFVGTDSFSFYATDGLADSNVATVSFDVARNFRRPFAHTNLSLTLDEDTSKEIALTGSDPDIPLDSLTATIADGPAAGTLTQVSGNTYRYTPDDNYAGDDEFSFTVSDGTFTSAPATVPITVNPINDPVVISATETMTAGLGYELEFQTAFYDPDLFDTHDVTINWGDGSVEGMGEVQDDGTVTGVLLRQGADGEGTLTRRHTYYSAGTLPAEICVTETTTLNLQTATREPAASAQTTCQTVQIDASPMAKVSLAVAADDLVTSGQSFTYAISVTNELPEDASGLTATGVTVDVAVDDGVTVDGISSSQGNCSSAGTPSERITCSFGSLAPGAQAIIEVDATVDAGVPLGELLSTQATLSHNQPDPAGEHLAAKTSTVVAPADYLVSGRGDGDDASAGDGVCATSAGVCTLRAAIQEANAAGSPRTIALADRTYVLGQDGASTAATATASLAVMGDITIVGLGADRTSIAGDGSSRVLTVQAGGALTIDGLTVSRGSTDGDGGGIYNAGTLRVENSSISGNSAADDGAGIYSDSGSSLTVTGSTISGNAAGDKAGGLYARGTVVVENSTISGNSAGGVGAGVRHRDGTLTLTNATIVDNTSGASGGGIYVQAGATTGMQNTIVAGNTDQSGTAPDCAGTVASATHSLVGAVKGCTITAASSVQFGADAQMGPLMDNGGGTMTHALQAGSPAIDAGTCALSVDQRGVARPQGGGCDVGAYERELLRVFMPLVMR